MGEIMAMLGRAPSELHLTRHDLVFLNLWLNRRNKLWGGK